jgi:hypothetical protein
LEDVAVDVEEPEVPRLDPTVAEVNAFKEKGECRKAVVDDGGNRKEYAD